MRTHSVDVDRVKSRRDSTTVRLGGSTVRRIVEEALTKYAFTAHPENTRKEASDFHVEVTLESYTDAATVTFTQSSEEVFDLETKLLDLEDEF